jgi:hypothetical protein
MPTREDYDPVQDAKAAREAAVVAEIEDTPGSRVTLPPIPTERLDETDAFRQANRKAQRLHMAFDLFRSLVSGCWREAIGPGNSTGKIRSWCWDQADAFIGEGDKPTPAVAAGAVKAATVDPIADRLTEVSVVRADGTVVMDFGKQVVWIGFDGPQAVALGELLIKHGKDLGA